MSDGRVITPEEKAQMFGVQPPQGEPTEQKEQASEPVKVVEKDFDITSFNNKFGREFTNEEEVKSFLEKAVKFDEVEASNSELTKKMAEYQNLVSKVDPMAHFLNEDEYIRQQFLKNSQGKMGEEVIKTVSSLSPSKLKDLNGVEALKIDLMVNEGLTGEEAEAYLQKKYDVEDFNSEDIDVATKASIKVDVKNAKNRLSELYKGIEIPSKVDYEQARVQLKETWDRPMNDLVKGIDKIQLEEGIDFIVTDEMKAGLLEETLNEVITRQLKPGKETAAELVGVMKDKIILRNMDKVVKSLSADIREQMKAELRKEVHNDKPLNTASRTTASTEDNDSKMRSLL
jgi:hypothetical protein